MRREWLKPIEKLNMNYYNKPLMSFDFFLTRGTPMQAKYKGSESLPDFNYPFGGLARIEFME
jgi:hypothetical protein